MIEDAYSTDQNPHDGGPAFPMPASETSIGGHYEQLGMSLRDWFAGQAVAGMLGGENEADGYWEPDHAAKRAYRIADAMLRARAESLPISTEGEQADA